MTPDEYRAAFPAWFTGGHDPSYPSWEELFNDADAPDNTGALIAREMHVIESKMPPAKRSGIDWFAHVEGMQALIDRCRVIYVRDYHDWLARNAPMGSRWRPHERLSRNHAGQPDGPDYGDMAGMGWDRARPWPQAYHDDHMKPVAETGKRGGKDGIILYGLGNFSDRPVGIKPMRPVYHLINRWWRNELGTPFRPNFGDDKVLTLPPEFDGRGIDPETRARALLVNVDVLNPAARFLCLALQEVDCHFGPRLAGLVARDQYRHADTSGK
ncbi:MAG: hypothetical protein ACK4G2_04825 [Novosphingobium sp.]